MATGKLKIDIRRARILEILQKEGQASVAYLSEALDVTQTTLRTDLDSLSEDGLLMRVTGGAILKPRSSSEKIAGTVIDYLEEKTAIAKRIAGKISDGDTLFFNSGTTTECVARVLAEEKSRLNIVTNSLAVANLLGSVKTVHVVLLGGEINTEYGFTYGGDAAEQLKRYQPKWAVLSVDGVDPQNGVSTYHAEEVMIDTLMIANAHHTIIAADHRKIGRTGFSHVCRLSECSCIVTDSACDGAILSALRQSGTDVETAGE